MGENMRKTTTLAADAVELAMAQRRERDGVPMSAREWLLAGWTLADLIASRDDGPATPGVALDVAS